MFLRTKILFLFSLLLAVACSEVLRFNTEADQANAIVNGLVDVGVHDEVVFAPDHLKEMGLKVAFKGKESYPAAFGFRKSEKELLSAYNEFFARATASGVVDSLRAVWLDCDGQYPDPLHVYPNNEPGEPIVVGTAGAVAPVSFRIEQDWFDDLRTILDPDFVKSLDGEGKLLYAGNVPVAVCVDDSSLLTSNYTYKGKEGVSLYAAFPANSQRRELAAKFLLFLMGK